LAGLAGFTINSPSTAPSTDAFAQQLAAALESYLGSHANASSLQMNIQATGSQTSGGSQFLVTITNPNAPTNPTAGATGSTTGTTGPTTSATPPATPSATTTATTATTTRPAPPAATEEDAYWAMQPPAVQALRNISDETARGTLAKQLADEGYTIDVPIMVWKWDPLATMTIRQNSGYTWVSSGDQSNLPTCPNCDLPGLPAYDPNNPSAGSIIVSTAFAKGLESTAPWGFSSQNS
jgi:hypothetical protein